MNRAFAIAFLALSAALSAGTGAHAADWPPADIGLVEIDDAIHRVNDGDIGNAGAPISLGNVDISAPGGNGAGLAIGGGTWTGTNVTVNSLTMEGAATGNINALPGNFAGRAVVIIGSNSNGNEISVRANEVTMGAGSFLGVGYDYDSGAAEAGTLDVGRLSLAGSGAQLWVSERGTLAADEVLLGDGGSLFVDGDMDGGLGGALTLNGGEAVIGANGAISNYAVNITAGTLRIAAGGELAGRAGAAFDSSGIVTVEGTMSGFNEVNVFTGGFTVARGGEVRGSGAGSTFTSHGNVTVNGSMNNFGGGVGIAEGDFTISSTGAVASAIRQSGGSLNMNGGLASAGIATSGGVLNLNTGANVTGAGLAVSGAANVQVNGAATATSLAMTGGSMNLNTGGALNATGAAGNLAGAWNMSGGEVSFGGAATFSGGTINVRNGGGRISSGGNLTISSALNVSDNLDIDMAGGGTFTIGGRLAVDYGENGSTPPLITVTGADTLANGGVRLTLDADAYTAFSTAGANGLLVLATDADAYTGTVDPIVSSSNAARYTYQFKEETPGNGDYGLYVTGIDVFGRGEMEANLINSWNKHPSVDGNARNLFNDSFINAVIDGYLLVNSDSPVLDDPSARLNAGALFGIMEREATGTGYDALMLYNGSGLAAANDATLNLNRHLLRRVSDRAGVIRREVIVEELEQPESVNEAEDPNLRLYGDPAATRIWAEGLYYADTGGAGEGFAGYDFDGKGLMIGADKRENDIWYGAALAYVSGLFRDKSALSGDGDIDSYAALVHGGWQDVSGLYVTGTLGYSYADNALRDSRRLNGTIGMNEADFGTHSFSVALEGGADVRVGEYLIVTPSAGLAYVTSMGSAHQQWFSGAGTGAQTLDAGKITGSSFSIPLGIAASMDVYGDEDSLLSVTGKAGYAYELQNKGARGEIEYGGLQGVIAPVRAASRTQGRHSWNLGLSARYLYDDMEFGLGYEYFGRDDYSSHAFTLSAGMNF